MTVLEADDFVSPKLMTVEIIGTIDGVNSVRIINQIVKWYYLWR